MKTPSHFNRVGWIAMSIVIGLYASFGTLGYLAYGTALKGSITLNLESEVTATSMQVCSYPSLCPSLSFPSHPSLPITILCMQHLGFLTHLA